MKRISQQKQSLERAKRLWDAIMAFVETSECVAAHGNSGEFYDGREAALEERAHETARLVLCNRFAETTGWKPFRSTTEEHDGVDTWSFEQHSQQKQNTK